MLPTTYKVKDIGEGTLSVMAKPVSGEWIEDEFTALKRLGIDKIVCLLEAYEQLEVGLGAEEELCSKNGINYSSFPIPDRGLPDTAKANAFTQELYQEIYSGVHAVVHCRAGIGRTGIIAGAILVKSGLSAKEAFAIISSARGVQVPDTEEQENWLCAF